MAARRQHRTAQPGGGRAGGGLHQRAGPGRRHRRFGAFTRVGIVNAWREHPFEWVEGRRLGVLHEYNRGIFQWLASTVELKPRKGGGTTLTHRIRIVPRGLLGRVAAAVEVGARAKRSLGRVYRRIDAYVCGKLGRPRRATPSSRRRG